MMFEKLFVRLGYVPLKELAEAKKKAALLEVRNKSQADSIKSYERQVEEMANIIALHLAEVTHTETDDGSLDYRTEVRVDMLKLMRHSDPHSLRHDHYYDEASQMIYYMSVGLMRQVERELNALLRLGPDAAQRTRDGLMRKAKNDYERYKHVLPSDRS